jgi:hypothetical protein
MKLLVKYKGRKNAPFHPRLRIATWSGFCPNQWDEMHFRPGTFCGAGCVADTSVEEAVKTYFSELRRMGYEAFTISRQDVKL